MYVSGIPCAFQSKAAKALRSPWTDWCNAKAMMGRTNQGFSTSRRCFAVGDGGALTSCPCAARKRGSCNEISPRATEKARNSGTKAASPKAAITGPAASVEAM
jgi:hypothetical protein